MGPREVASKCRSVQSLSQFLSTPSRVVFVVPAATLAFLGQTDAVEALARPIAGRQWPHALAALAVRNYRLYLSAQAISTTGLWMQRIAQDWLVLELSGSVAAVGVAVALQFLPVLMFGLVGGVLADRYPKRTLLMLTQTIAATLAVVLGLLALTGTAQVWHVYLIATLLGFVTVVDNPTRQVFVAELVGDRHVRNAVSLNSSVFQFGALVGPALSGLLIHAVGQGWSFLINAASCLVVVIMLAVIRLQPGTVTVPDRTPGQLGAGLRYLREVSEISWTIVLVATMGILGLNMPVILAAFANSEFATGVGGYSLFNSLTAVGALSGALLSARRVQVVRLRTLVGLLIGFGGVLAVASLAPNVYLFGALLVGCGLLTLLFLTGANTLVQLSSAPTLRGRVMSVYVLVLLGGQAIGGPAVGWLVDQFGARSSMFWCGGLIVLLATVTGAAMAHQSHLRVEIDLRRLQGHSLVHIVHA
jgi:MFS family permease